MRQPIMKNSLFWLDLYWVIVIAAVNDSVADGEPWNRIVFSYDLLWELCFLTSRFPSLCQLMIVPNEPQLKWNYTVIKVLKFNGTLNRLFCFLYCCFWFILSSFFIIPSYVQPLKICILNNLPFFPINCYTAQCLWRCSSFTIGCLWFCEDNNNTNNNNKFMFL